MNYLVRYNDGILDILSSDKINFKKSKAKYKDGRWYLCTTLFESDNLDQLHKMKDQLSDVKVQVKKIYTKSNDDYNNALLNMDLVPKVVLTSLPINDVSSYRTFNEVVNSTNSSNSDSLLNVDEIALNENNFNKIDNDKDEDKDNDLPGLAHDSQNSSLLNVDEIALNENNFNKIDNDKDKDKDNDLPGLQSDFSNTVDESDEFDSTHKKADVTPGKSDDSSDSIKLQMDSSNEQIDLAHDKVRNLDVSFSDQERLSSMDISMESDNQNENTLPIEYSDENLSESIDDNVFVDKLNTKENSVECNTSSDESIDFTNRKWKRLRRTRYPKKVSFKPPSPDKNDSDLRSSDSNCNNSISVDVDYNEIVDDEQNNNNIIDEEQNKDSMDDEQDQNRNNEQVNYENNCDRTSMTVQSSEFGGKWYTKYNYCTHCKKKFARIDRHLVSIHFDDPQVKKIIEIDHKILKLKAEKLTSDIRKLNITKRELFAEIRNNMNGYYNTHKEVNKGDIIPVRRPNKDWNKSALDFLPCPECNATHSMNNLRHHYDSKHRSENDKTRTILRRARQKVKLISDKVNEKMKNRILPYLRDDSIKDVILGDDLIIMYGNKQSRKHSHEHLNTLIRSDLRLLGRLLVTMRIIDSTVYDFASLIDPQKYDNVLKAVDKLARYNDKTNKYESNHAARNSGTLLKKIAEEYELDMIKQNNVEMQEKIQRFLKLIDRDYGVSVNRRVTESQVAKQRSKKIEIPLLSDIQILLDHLRSKRITALKSLEKEFTFQNWLTVLQTTLVIVLVFNRKRPGEHERTFIEDFKNYKIAQKGSESYDRLTEEEKLASKTYYIYEIRGKLNRTVTVYLSESDYKSYTIILRYRKMANIPEDNPFVYGLPSNTKDRYRHLEACRLLREFSNQCGAEIPKLLRATFLRKHSATKCRNFTEDKIVRVASHLGHSVDIHKGIYRQNDGDPDVLDALEEACGDKPSKKTSKFFNSNQVVDSQSDIDASNLSSSLNTSEETENLQQPLHKPTGKVNSRSRSNHHWSKAEDDILKNEFSYSFTPNGKLPTFLEIRKIKNVYSHLPFTELKNAAIKTHLHNLIRKDAKRTNMQKSRYILASRDNRLGASSSMRRTYPTS